MSCLASKPKYNVGDIVDFNLISTYRDCDGQKGEVNQKVTGEVVGMYCNIQIVTDGINNWHYYIARSGMKHIREEYEISFHSEV